MRVGEIEITKVILFYTFYFHKKTWKLEKITQNENSHEWSISPEVRALWRVGEKSVINGNPFLDTLEFTKKSLIFVCFISSVKTCFFLKFQSFLVKKCFFRNSFKWCFGKSYQIIEYFRLFVNYCQSGKNKNYWFGHKNIQEMFL